MKYVLEPINKPVTQFDALGSGYVGNTHLVVWTGRHEHKLFFHDISKSENEGWFALCEGEN